MDFSLSPYAPGREMPLYNFGSQETEEERRRRELQARMDAQARQAAMSDEAVASGGGVAPVEPTPIKETRTIDPTTGEVQLTIKGSERDLSSANPNTPTYSGAARPVAPGADMAAYTAQQESGANPNIGYHFAPDATGQRKSTAFGTYGLTAPAYQDVQRANPAFANRPITSLTPEEQTAAFNTYTGLNAQRLKGLGVEPTQGNVQLAHLLGPSGAAKFLQTGEVSEAAAAANGGVENLKRIAQGRLAGGQAPASGAAPIVPQAQPAPGVAVATGQGVQGTMTTPVSPEAPLPANQGIRIPGLTPVGQMPAPAPSLTAQAQQMFQQNQDNVDALMQMRNDPNTPEYLRKRSADRAYELMNAQYRTQQAQDKLTEMIASGDQNAIARVMTSKPKDEEGSWLKMIALGFLSPQLAGQEAIKLGLAPTKWEDSTLTRDDGTEVGVQLQRRADGKILGGTYSDGTRMSADDVAAAQAGSLGKGVHVTKVQTLIDPVTKQLVNRQTLSNGKERDLSGGKLYTGDKSKLADAGEAVKQEDRRVNAAYNVLTRDIPNPTPQQKLAALRNAGVPDARIESELGMRVSPGTAPAAPPASYVNPTAPAAAPATTPTARKPQSPFLTLPGNEVFDPDNPPVVREGERKESGAARLKAWENKKKDYDHNISQLYATKDSARTTVSDIDTLMNSALGRITGIPGKLPNVPGFAGADTQALLEKVNATSFIKGAQGMRGLGALSDKEGDAIRSSYAALNKSQSEDSFRRNLVLYKEQVKRSQNLLDESLGQPPTFPDAMSVEQIRGAFSWLDKNANDKRAADVRRKLGLPQ